MISWLSSYPKSGSTWVRMLLNAYFDEGHLDINVLPWGAGDNRRYPYQVVSPIPLENLTRDDIVLLRPAALMHLIYSARQKPMFVKSHNCHGAINDIPLFPARLTKRAFYIVRDPRDVAISWANHLGISIDKAIEHMDDDNWSIGDDEIFFHVLSSWSKHVDSWLGDKPYQVHLIKYERLLQDPHSVLKGILEAVGFDELSDERIAKAVKATKFSALKKQEKDKKFEEAPEDRTFFRKGKSTWRQVLTEEQVNKIETAHHETMNKLGYGTITLRNQETG